MNKERVASLVLPILDARRAFLVDINIRGERGETVVQVLVDTDPGISIGTCAEISRELGRVVDEERLFETRYRLEVSSPGLEKPLRMLRQYGKNVGRSFRVRYRTATDERSEVLTLRGVEGESTAWESRDRTSLVIPFGDILDCRVELPW